MLSQTNMGKIVRAGTIGEENPIYLFSKWMKIIHYQILCTLNITEIEQIVGIHYKIPILVAFGKEKNNLDKILSSYCDIRVDTLKQMTEKRNENENVIINADTNHVQEGDNENKKEKNRYVAEDDVHNNVTNTMTLGNDYLLGAEIWVNDDISKNEKDSSSYFYNRKYNQSIRNDENAK